MFISVIVPTLNRDRALRKILGYFLTEEAYPRFEILVIDQSDAHDSATSELLTDPRIRHVRCDYKNLPRARNHGISLASGEVVLFVDDDCEPQPGFLEAHAAEYIDAEVIGTAGPTPAPGQPLVGHGEVGEEQYREMMRVERARHDVSFPYTAQWAPGGNCSYRRDLCQKLGGFDETFRGAAIGEDAEFSHRARRHGKIRYTPRALLVHRHVASGGCRDIAAVAQYVRALVFSVNYFWYRVEASTAHRLRQLWRLLRSELISKRHAPFHVLTGFVQGFLASERHARAVARGETPAPGNSYWQARTDS